MAEASAQLNGYRQTPRKTRRVADLMRGKSVADAGVILQFTIKRPASPLKKLLDSAVANAKSQGLSEENLFVKEVRVDAGTVMRKIRPASRGSAHPIRRRTSHVQLTLSTEMPAKLAKRTAKKAEKKARTKKAAK